MTNDDNDIVNRVLKEWGNNPDTVSKKVEGAKNQIKLEETMTNSRSAQSALDALITERQKLIGESESEKSKGKR